MARRTSARRTSIQVATSGVRFDRFYANSPVCSPTRAALLTGRYPDLVGVPGVIRTHAENNWGYLTPHAVLLPQVFRKAGYRTALVGKWHLGLKAPSLPNAMGFETFHGYLGDMMDDYTTHRRHGINYMRRDDQVIDPKGARHRPLHAVGGRLSQRMQEG